MAKSTIQTETAFAAEAFHRYLQLPNPRNWRDLVGQRAEAHDGTQGKPYTLSAIQSWMASHRWVERAREFDEEVAAREREKIMRWRVKEAEKRERARLEGSEAQREMALGYIKHPDDETVEPELRGKVRAMAECDPQYLSLANTYLKTAADIERADLGPAMRRLEEMDERKPSPVIVLTSEGLDQLRDMVSQIKDAPVPQITMDDMDDVVDADFEDAS